MYRLGRPTETPAYNPNFPLVIGGLLAWFDAADDSTFTYSSGVVVSQWNDKSGSGRHASQGTVANQPSRSGVQLGPTVVFDGVNDVLTSSTFAIAQPISILAVFKTTSVANQYIVGNVTSPSSPSMAIVTPSHLSCYAGTFISDAGAQNTALHQATAILNGASSSISRDGTTLASGNAGSSTWKQVALGAQADGAAPLAGQIAEVLVYGALSGSDRTALESWMRTKWRTP